MSHHNELVYLLFPAYRWWDTGRLSNFPKVTELKYRPGCRVHVPGLCALCECFLPSSAFQRMFRRMSQRGGVSHEEHQRDKDYFTERRNYLETSPYGFNTWKTDLFAVTAVGCHCFGVMEKFLMSLIIWVTQKSHESPISKRMCADVPLPPPF